jgi:hypothetical protein
MMIVLSYQSTNILSSGKITVILDLDYPIFPSLNYLISLPNCLEYCLIVLEISLSKMRSGMLMLNPQVLVGYESTGPYAESLVHYLANKQVKIVQVNPLHTKKMKEVNDNSPLKTDDKDPRVIADIVRLGRALTVVVVCVQTFLGTFAQDEFAS